MTGRRQLSMSANKPLKEALASYHCRWLCGSLTSPWLAWEHHVRVQLNFESSKRTRCHFCSAGLRHQRDTVIKTAICLDYRENQQHSLELSLGSRNMVACNLLSLHLEREYSDIAVRFWWQSTDVFMDQSTLIGAAYYWWFPLQRQLNIFDDSYHERIAMMMIMVTILFSRLKIAA